MLSELMEVGHERKIRQLQSEPRNKPQPDANALDAFVSGEGMQQSKQQPIEKKPLKRLTFDIAAIKGLIPSAASHGEPPIHSGCGSFCASDWMRRRPIIQRSPEHGD